jgi:hypothetical protein
VEKLDGLNGMKKLRVLYLSNNNIKNFDELIKLKDLPALEELLLLGNPMYATCARSLPCAASGCLCRSTLPLCAAALALTVNSVCCVCTGTKDWRSSSGELR